MSREPSYGMAERWLTYQQAGELLGMSAEAFRQRLGRLGWRKMKGNDGRALVLVPETLPALHPRHRSAAQTADGPGDQSGEVAQLLTLLEQAQAEAAAERARAAEAERQREEARIAAAVAETEAKALRAAVAREIRRLEDAEAGRLAAETQRDAAQSIRFALQAEISAWTAGGPLARAWRAFLNRRGPP